MSLEEEQTKLKQAYLREEIMEREYNPIHFANYLAKERENGDDIDNWSLGSLKKIVIQFKEEYPDPLSDDEVDEENPIQNESDLSDDNYDDEEDK